MAFVAPEAVAALGAKAASAGSSAPPSSPAVRLAGAIALLWVAGLCLFIAFGPGARDLTAWSAPGGGIGSLRRAVQSIFSRGAGDIASAEGVHHGH